MPRGVDARLDPADLKTTEGESIEVEQPGNWNLEVVPTFSMPFCE